MQAASCFTICAEASRLFNDLSDSVNYFWCRGAGDVIADDAEVSRISDLKFTPGGHHGSSCGRTHASVVARV